eukprot:2612486-Amphidinium_carterae.1
MPFDALRMRSSRMRGLRTGSEEGALTLTRKKALMYRDQSHSATASTSLLNVAVIDDGSSSTDFTVSLVCSTSHMRVGARLKALQVLLQLREWHQALRMVRQLMDVIRPRLHSMWMRPHPIARIVLLLLSIDNQEAKYHGADEPAEDVIDTDAGNNDIADSGFDAGEI